MTDYANSSLWDLAYNLDPTNQDLCAHIDGHLANKLEDMDNLLEIYYYLCYGEMHTLLPSTKKKINELLSEELKDVDNIQWWQFKNFAQWFEGDLKDTLAKEWLDNDNADLDVAWMVNSLDADIDTNLKILEKLVRMYKKKKSSEIVNVMERIFVGMVSDRIDEACAIVSKSTPAVIASLLKRNDISEKYTLKGLKALSKLSKQRELNIQIDFDTLKHLGPKARLDAMKQLMGMFDKYYQFKQTVKPSNYSYGYNYKERRLKSKAKEYSLPFKTVPKKEDIERFLFPCCLKYNDEVVSMMQRFDELTSQKEEDNG